MSPAELAARNRSFWTLDASLGKRALVVVLGLVSPSLGLESVGGRAVASIGSSTSAVPGHCPRRSLGSCR